MMRKVSIGICVFVLLALLFGCAPGYESQTYSELREEKQQMAPGRRYYAFSSLEEMEACILGEPYTKGNFAEGAVERIALDEIKSYMHQEKNFAGYVLDAAYVLEDQMVFWYDADILQGLIDTGYDYRLIVFRDKQTELSRLAKRRGVELTEEGMLWEPELRRLSFDTDGVRVVLDDLPDYMLDYEKLLPYTKMKTIEVRSQD